MMNALPTTTLRRLMKLPQTPTVWEGDRRSLDGLDNPETSEKPGQFILWVDGAEGMVRSMDIITIETGPEAIVRALIKAMEQPQSPARPSRPQKIVVRDREIQFFLRGVPQDLEITVDYVTELPIIDELFERLAEIRPPRQPKLPPQYADLLIERAYELWADAPWELVADHQVISIELNQWDLGTLYATVIGMLELDYGIILYRSLDSLMRFRSAALGQGSMGEIEQAFLGQDCLFLTFSSETEDEDEDVDIADLPLSEITPQFGSIHPFEGMRPTLYDEEAIALAVTLEAIHKFFSDCHRKLHNNFPSLKKTYNITPPPDLNHPEIIPQPIPVTIVTLTEVAAELIEMGEAEYAEDEEVQDEFPLKDDLVPTESFYSLGVMPWDVFDMLKHTVKHHQPNLQLQQKGEGLPLLMLQTTRPKAKAIVERIVEAGGLEGIAFTLGENPFEEDTYDIAVLKMENQDMYFFHDFPIDDPIHVQAMKKWHQRCHKTKDICGFMIATGFAGASKGKPGGKDMYALFEVRHITSKELGLGTLQMVMKMEWDS